MTSLNLSNKKRINNVESAKVMLVEVADLKVVACDVQYVS